MRNSEVKLSMCKRRKVVNDFTQDKDRITALPESLKECILKRMTSPLDATRTRILSRDWRHLCFENPRLIIDKEFMEQLLKIKEEDYNQDIFIAVVISELLLSRSVPIQEFILYLPWFSISSMSSHIDRWMVMISGSHIQKLCIHNINRHRYKIPSCVLNSPQLTHLHLHSCILSPEALNVKSPNKFVSIHLEKTDFSDELMRALLLPSIDSIQDLAFVDCKGVECLTILQVPNLRSFQMDGCLGFNWKFLEINRIPECVIIKPAVDTTRRQKDVSMINFAKTFDNLCNTKDLRLNNSSLQFLTAGGFTSFLPSSTTCLTKICLRKFRFYLWDHVSCALSLLRSSPNVTCLEINMAKIRYQVTEHEDILNAVENRTWLDKGLKKLTKVKLKGLYGFNGELPFIKLLLSNSPRLQSLTIESMRKNLDEVRFISELRRSSRASASAKIFNNVENGLLSRPKMYDRDDDDDGDVVDLYNDPFLN